MLTNTRRGLEVPPHREREATLQKTYARLNNDEYQAYLKGMGVLHSSFSDQAREGQAPKDIKEADAKSE